MHEPVIKINLDDIKRLENYRGYKEIWVYTPTMYDNDLHIGYLDGTFFAYVLSAYGHGINISDPYSVIDYYLDHIFFKIESIEINLVTMNDRYRRYKNALDGKRGMMAVNHQSL